MSLIYLNSSDFEYDEDTKSLLITRNDIVFVMFYSKTCGHCVKYFPEYTKIPTMFAGIKFAACCLDANNMAIAQFSQKSRTPITSVPKFIIYKNKRPWMEYTGEKSNNAICRYLGEMLRAGSQPAAGGSGGSSSSGGIRVVGSQQQHQHQPQQQPQQHQHHQPQQQPHSSRPQPQQVGGAASGGGFALDPNTKVPVFETSYGIPYNSTAQQYLQYEQAYNKN